MTNRNQIIAAFAIVFNEKGEILLGQRNERDTKHVFHKKWSAPGGIVDFGEKPVETAVRETQEETGVIIAIEHAFPVVKSFVYKDGLTKEAAQDILLFYPAKYISGEPNAEKDTGTSDVKWFDIDKINPDEFIVSKELINEVKNLMKLC